MFTKPSLLTRIIVGKSVGFLIGLIPFFVVPALLPESTLVLRIGLVLWYTTMGAIIAVFGVVTWHPVLRLPMPWWLRAPLVGGWLNFVLMLFAHEQMRLVLQAAFGPGGTLQSPFWFVLIGCVAGLLIGFLATSLGGEGQETAAVMDRAEAAAEGIDYPGAV